MLKPNLKHSKICIVALALTVGLNLDHGNKLTIPLIVDTKLVHLSFDQLKKKKKPLTAGETQPPSYGPVGPTDLT